MRLYYWIQVLLCTLVLSTGTVSAVPQSVMVRGPLTPLERLISGNRRFVEGPMERPNQSVQYRRSLAAGQHPFAGVVCCIDSRVQPVLIFDAGFGDLMVFTSPAGISNPHDNEGLLYGAEHLNLPLILVLGHGKCGAVTAAVESKGKPGHFPNLMAALSTSIINGLKRPGNAVHNCTKEAVLETTRKIRALKLPHAPQVVPAMYDLESGVVTVLTE